MQTILLIDGKNTAYRSVFSNGDPTAHPFAIWSRLASTWVDKFKPDQVHVFWDCPRKKVWRKKILNEYKESRDAETFHTNADGVRDSLNKLIDAAKAILPYMGVRQYDLQHQECDDLIYTVCRLLAPPRHVDREVIIISSDSDFTQIQFRMPYVRCYNPIKAEFFDDPEVDPAMQKALAGDKSDNVDGYRGIGEVKSKRMLNDYKLLNTFLETNGDKIYRRNLALVDMSLNPFRVTNTMYVCGILAQDVQFDKQRIQKLIMEHKVAGLLAEYSRIILPFKSLADVKDKEVG